MIADAVKFVPADADYDTATWRPGVAGSYDVYARWTAHANRAGNARYRIDPLGRRLAETEMAKDALAATLAKIRTSQAEPA